MDDALTVATVHAAANLVAHGIGEVGAAFGFAEGGKVVEVVLLVEGAVEQRLVAFVHVSLCQLHVMAVLAGQQCLVELDIGVHRPIVSWCKDTMIFLNSKIVFMVTSNNR